MNLYVVRHGETIWNKEHRVQGITDMPLTEKGIEDTKELIPLVRDLNIDVVISSPLKRAKDTAKILVESRLPINTDDRIKERNYGTCEGITLEERLELKRNYPIVEDVWNYTKNIDFNGIEPMHDFCKRIYIALDDITERYKDKNVLIVTHGGAFFPINCYLNKKPLESIVDRKSVKGLQNCEVAKFEI